MEFDDRNSRSSFDESELAESQGTEDVEQSKGIQYLAFGIKIKRKTIYQTVSPALL